MKELKPCPFCGGKSDFKRIGTSRTSCIIECEDCGCRLESNESYENSGDQWNKRVELNKVEKQHTCQYSCVKFGDSYCDGEEIER